MKPLIPKRQDSEDQSVKGSAAAGLQNSERSLQRTRVPVVRKKSTLMELANGPIKLIDDAKRMREKIADEEKSKAEGKAVEVDDGDRIRKLNRRMAKETVTLDLGSVKGLGVKLERN